MYPHFTQLLRFTAPLTELILSPLMDDLVLVPVLCPRPMWHLTSLEAVVKKLLSFL